MTYQEIFDQLKKEFSDCIIEMKGESVFDPFIKVYPEKICEIALYLRDTHVLQFDYLMCLSGVDYGNGILGVVYHLNSLKYHHKITLKVEVPVEKPEVPSVSMIWPSANWHEREAYDLLGIVFTGHPDLRRILLPDDWVGFPLRKDYKAPEFYNGMKIPY